MTNKIHSLTVALSVDIRDDEITPLIEAIKMIRGVADVATHVAGPDSWMAEIRAKKEFREKLNEVLK